MGVVYKLKPKVKEFILKKQKTDPRLSCRKLAALVLKRFQIKLSKSRINTILKSIGLSMPVGRRRKIRRGVAEGGGLGAILLKAADYLVGGSYYITEAIKRRTNSAEPEILSRTQALIYKPLFEISEDKPLKPDCGLWTLINKQFTVTDLLSYLTEIQGVSALASDIYRIITTAFQEVRLLKMGLSSSSNFYLDGQLHTVWSTPNIPLDFSTTIYNIKSYLKKYFVEGAPFVLFMAPGYDMPIKEFFDFMQGMEGLDKKISFLSLYGQKLGELEMMRVEAGARRVFIFGLWPWQFVNYRKLKSLGEFRLFSFEPLKENFYLADIELELLQPSVNKGIILRGAALKRAKEEKTRLIVLSNASPDQFSAEQLANRYLSRWPNLEEGFKDFSRKIELFTYTAGSQRFFSTENLTLERPKAEDVKGMLEYYLRALDLYSRWHFLPSGYEEKDFPTAKERFYNLKARMKKYKEYTTVAFKAPSEYKFTKDLEYALRRLNEREIAQNDGQRLWFGP